MQFSSKNQFEVIQDLTDDVDLFDSAWGTFQQYKKNTFYQKPLEKCVELMKSIDLINGKKPEKLCILMTDGLPMDCGGKKNMFSPITQPLVSGTTRAEDCQTEAVKEGVKIQTIFIQTGSRVSEFNHQSLAILATISHCDSYKEQNPPSSGLTKEVKGTYKDGSDCPYMRAAISSSTRAYSWLRKQADELVEAVLEPVVQLCPRNYLVFDWAFYALLVFHKIIPRAQLNNWL
jgi:hypothetical protein